MLQSFRARYGSSCSRKKDMEAVKATFNAMKASSMARRLTTKSARRRSAWLQINNALD